MDDDLRDEIIAGILGEFGGEHQAQRRAAAAADAIIKLVQDEREDDHRSWVIDNETRGSTRE